MYKKIHKTLALKFCFEGKRGVREGETVKVTPSDGGDLFLAIFFWVHEPEVRSLLPPSSYQSFIIFFLQAIFVSLTFIQCHITHTLSSSSNIPRVEKRGVDERATILFDFATFRACNNCRRPSFRSVTWIQVKRPDRQPY